MTHLNFLTQFFIFLAFIIIGYSIRALSEPAVRSTVVSLTFREYFRREKCYIRIQQSLNLCNNAIRNSASPLHTDPDNCSTKIELWPATIAHKRGKKKGSKGGGLRRPNADKSMLRVVKLIPRGAPPGAKLTLDHTHHVIDLDIVKGVHIKVQITRYEIYRYWDPRRKRIVRAKGPEPGVRYGMRYRAFVLTLYYCDGLSVNAIYNFMKSFFGENCCSKQAILAWIREASEILKPFYDELTKLAKLAKSIGMDETGVRVNGVKMWMWLLTTGFLVIYHLDSHRSRAVAQKLLDGFTGLLTSDFFRAYDNLNCSQQKCLIHLMRKVADVMKKVAKEILHKQEQLRVQEELRESDAAGTRRKGRPKKVTRMTDDELEQLREEISRKINVASTGTQLIHFISQLTKGEISYEDARVRINEMIEQLKPYKELRKVRLLLSRYSSELIEFLKWPSDMHRDAWHNNDTERCVKAFAKYRRRQSFRSVSTVMSIAVVLSVIESYRRLIGEFCYEMWVRIRTGDFEDLERLKSAVIAILGDA